MPAERNESALSSLAQALVDRHILNEGPRVVDTEYWALSLSASVGEVANSLAELAERGLLLRSDCWICPSCNGHQLRASDTCRDCGTERTADVLFTTDYLRPYAPATRDPLALLLVHGMNSFGSWEEMLGWRIALLYGHSVAFYIFKYGRTLLSTLFTRLQRRKVKKLGVAITKATEELAESRPGAVCDVAAHSFGTLLFAMLLQDPEFRALRFGRVILMGSIIRSDFDWATAIDSGRVEAVLNHRAVNDRWVPLAPWFIPGAGCSGVRGFLATASVIEVESREFGHTGFFTAGDFERQTIDTWSPFLEGKQVLATHAPSAAGAEQLASLHLVAGRTLSVMLAVAIVAAIMRLVIR